MVEAVDPRLERIAGGFMSFDDVREALVEAVELYRRYAARGRFPFASDGPWHLISRRNRDAYTGGDKSPARMPRMPLSKVEVARMRERLEWLMLVPDDTDRRIIVLAIEALADGEGRVPWGDLVRPMGASIGPDGLRMRYVRALGALTRRVNLEMKARKTAEISNRTCQDPESFRT
ncbi:hypothetical protein [Sphingomonas sp. OTU376]|uniref:hypothetical protein n=1 Tax=Sphingomonas sp. OTU376 TaxID=3043863 RepID=UPI00313AFADD